jgi:hypothetical protein
MFRSDDDLSDGIPLGNTYHVTASSLVENSANLAMVTPVRHAFVNAGIYLDNNTGSRLILLKQLAQPQFPMLSGSLCQEAACT